MRLINLTQRSPGASQWVWVPKPGRVHEWDLYHKPSNSGWYSTVLLSLLPAGLDESPSDFKVTFKASPLQNTFYFCERAENWVKIVRSGTIDLITSFRTGRWSVQANSTFSQDLPLWWVYRFCQDLPFIINNSKFTLKQPSWI